MTPQEIAHRYFQLSNASDFDGIAQLMGPATTYRAGSGEFFRGVDDIMAMQRAYHGSFVRLAWTVTGVTEPKPGVVRLEFTFAGESDVQEPVAYRGVEHVVVVDDVIVHLDVERRG